MAAAWEASRQNSLVLEQLEQFKQGAFTLYLIFCYKQTIQSKLSLFYCLPIFPYLSSISQLVSFLNF